MLADCKSTQNAGDCSEVAIIWISIDRDIGVVMAGHIVTTKVPCFHKSNLQNLKGMKMQSFVACWPKMRINGRTSECKSSVGCVSENGGGMQVVRKVNWKPGQITSSTERYQLWDSLPAGRWAARLIYNRSKQRFSLQAVKTSLVLSIIWDSSFLSSSCAVLWFITFIVVLKQTKSVFKCVQYV